MKKYTLLAFIILCSIHVSAQIIYVGGGLSYSRSSLFYTSPYGFTIGYYGEPVQKPYFSASCEVLDNKPVSLTGDVHSYALGAERSDKERAIPANGPNGANVEFRYLSFDLLGNTNINFLKKKLRLQLQAGPRFDMIVDHNLQANLYNDINDLNYGITAGGSLSLIVKHFVCSVRGLYFYAQKPIVDNVLGDTRFRIDDNPMLLQISLGYKFRKI